MNNSESHSSPPNNDLLQEMMPKLGMEATDPAGQYKKKARTKYFLPKVAILCVLIVLIVAAAFVMLLPVRFQDVELAEAFDQAQLSFRLDRLFLLESVTATLDDHPIDVTLLDAGAYQLETDRNGEVTVVARTLTDRYTTISMTIDCIDDQSPKLDHDQRYGNFLYIYLTDGEGKNCSGIDWQTLSVTKIDSGAAMRVKVDEEAGYVRFSLPDESVRVYVEDHNGNPLSLRLDRTPPTD